MPIVKPCKLNLDLTNPIEHIEARKYSFVYDISTDLINISSNLSLIMPFPVTLDIRY